MALDDDVKRVIREGKGFAVIIAGSDSDRPHIDKITASLREYGVSHQVRICSAHKQPTEIMQIVNEYDFGRNESAQPLVYIAVAGGTDALSGLLSFQSLSPVISCPPDAPNDSCLKNPPGSSNAYIANPKNVGRFVAQLFSHIPGTNYAAKLIEEIQAKVGKLQAADAELSKFPYTPAEVKK